MGTWFLKPVRLLSRGVGCLNMLHPMDVHKLHPKVVFLGKAGMPGRLTTLRIRQIGYKPLLVRSGTTDFNVLRMTFLDRYHLPPRKMPDSPTILDLGSNVGYTICHFGYLYRNAKIIGVEMDTDNFRLAQKNTADIPNCTLLNRATSVSNSVASYYKSGIREDAYHISDQGKPRIDSEITIQCCTIQSIIDEFSLAGIDYVKMDIEGEETRVFDEALSDLRWLAMVKMLNIEVHKSSEDLEMILTVLRTRGFNAWKDNRHWSAVMAARD